MSNVICCDLDEVVFDWLHPFVKFARDNSETFSLDKNKIPNDLRKWTHWNGYENYGINRDQFSLIYKEFCKSGAFKTLPPISGGCDINDRTGKILTNLGNKKHLFFVTARAPEVILDTVDSLNNIGAYNWHSLIHLAGKKDKTLSDCDTSVIYSRALGVVMPSKYDTKRSVYEDLKPFIVIDDRPEYIEQAFMAYVPHVIMVSRLHNKKWRSEKSSRLPPFQFDSISKQYTWCHATLHIVRPNWVDINASLEGIFKGQENEQNDNRIKR